MSIFTPDPPRDEDVWDEDEDCGYELADPKHPTFYERMADYADLLRKHEREDR